MNKHWIRLGMVALLLGSMQISQPMQAQEVAREAKLHTYVMENPYDVPEIKAPKGKKVKNVVLMIGDATTVVANSYCAIDYAYLHRFSESHDVFVDAVVDDFFEKDIYTIIMSGAVASLADIHSRTRPDMIVPL